MTVVPTDVTRADEVERLIAETSASLGPPDALVNCAGVYGPIGPSHEVDAAAWARAIEVNLVGTFLCCRAVLPTMIARRRGRIVNMSGGGATAPLARFSAYAASKAAVVRLTETLAEEVAGDGVQVNAIAPGAIDTSLQDEVLAAGERAGDLFRAHQGAARERRRRHSDRAAGRAGGLPRVGRLRRADRAVDRGAVRRLAGLGCRPNRGPGRDGLVYAAADRPAHDPTARGQGAMTATLAGRAAGYGGPCEVVPRRVGAR